MWRQLFITSLIIKKWKLILRLILALCHKILCIIYKTSFYVEILILVHVVTTHMSLTNKKKIIISGYSQHTVTRLTVVCTLERNIAPCSQFLVKNFDA